MPHEAQGEASTLSDTLTTIRLGTASEPLCRGQNRLASVRAMARPMDGPSLASLLRNAFGQQAAAAITITILVCNFYADYSQRQFKPTGSQASAEDLLVRSRFTTISMDFLWRPPRNGQTT